jgi:hypothetical protein
VLQHRDAEGGIERFVGKGDLTGIGRRKRCPKIVAVGVSFRDRRALGYTIESHERHL